MQHFTRANAPCCAVKTGSGKSTLLNTLAGMTSRSVVNAACTIRASAEALQQIKPREQMMYVFSTLTAIFS